VEQPGALAAWATPWISNCKREGVEATGPDIFQLIASSGPIPRRAIFQLDSILKSMRIPYGEETKPSILNIWNSLEIPDQQEFLAEFAGTELTEPQKSIFRGSSTPPWTTRHNKAASIV